MRESVPASCSWKMSFTTTHAPLLKQLAQKKITQPEWRNGSTTSLTLAQSRYHPWKSGSRISPSACTVRMFIIILAIASIFFTSLMCAVFIQRIFSSLLATLFRYFRGAWRNASVMFAKWPQLPPFLAMTQNWTSTPAICVNTATALYMQRIPDSRRALFVKSNMPWIRFVLYPALCVMDRHCCRLSID